MARYFQEYVRYTYTYQVAVNKSQSTDYRTMAPGCLFHISIGKATAFGYDFPDSHIALLVLLVLLHRSNADAWATRLRFACFFRLWTGLNV